MSEEKKLLHKLSIDLKRDIEDIKNNMSMYEFTQWAKYYNSIITLDTVSFQLSQLSYLFYSVNFEGDKTIHDFLPNSTEEERKKALLELRQNKINEELKKLEDF